MSQAELRRWRGVVYPLPKSYSPLVLFTHRGPFLTLYARTRNIKRSVSYVSMRLSLASPASNFLNPGGLLPQKGFHAVPVL